MRDTFAGCLDAAADRWPGREAVVVGPHRLTFAALAEESRVLAAGWLRLGVGRGDRVGLWLENGPAWVLAFFALARLGAVVVPCSTRWTAHELGGVLRQAKPRALLIGDRFRRVEFASRLAEIEEAPADMRVVSVAGRPPSGAVPLESLRGPAPSAAERRRLADLEAAGDAGDVAVVQFTSGSTAFPKGAMLRQGAMIGYVRDYGRRLGVTPDDRVLCQLPFFHIGGLNHGLLVPAVQGATIVTAEAFDPEVALAQMEQEACTVFGGVASMYFMLADHAADPQRAFAGIEKAWILGSAQAARRAQELTAVRGLVSLYGATELSGGTTFGDVRDPLERRLSSAGRSLPGVETRIVDPATGEPCPPGVAGEIRQRTARRMNGYHGVPPESWGFDDEGWYRTGDLGSLDAEGYLAYEGRLKDMLKVGGENVACPEVEDVLTTHPDVTLAAVVGVDDDRLVEVPVAFVVPRRGGTVSAEALTAHCARFLAAFKVPRRVLLLDALPMTASGKVEKAALRALVREAGALRAHRSDSEPLASVGAAR